MGDRTPFKAMRSKSKIPRSCIDCHKSLPNDRFMYCDDVCRDASKDKIKGKAPKKR